jgi:hypothetical protein
MARTGTGSRTTREGGTARSIPLQRVDAGVKERNEMTIGRTDDPENPVSVTASRSRRTVWDWIADPIWASGHAPRQQAGHMNAVDPPVRLLANALEPKGPSTQDMIYAESAGEIETRRRAFLRKWRLKCPAVAASLEEALLQNLGAGQKAA